jgi:hypothetical protein
VGATEGYQTGLVDFGLNLTAPTDPIGLRDAVDLQWTWQTLPLNTTITVYADPDGQFNGNEIYVLEDAATDPMLVHHLGAAPQHGLYRLFARDIGVGTFTLGIIVTDPRTGQQSTHRAASPITIQPDGALIVNSLANTDANDGELTLREAIQAAARAGVGIADAPGGDVYHYAGADPDDAKAIDIIRFHSSLAGQTIDLSASSLSPIQSPLAIEALDENGDPIAITISGGGVHRIMSITSSAGRVWLDGLTLTSGYTTTGGGAIYNEETDLRLSGVLITDSQAVDSHGGGIYTTGPTRLTDSSVVGCQATTTHGQNISIYGGGIYSTNRLALIRAEVVGNVAKRSYSTLYYNAAGGGISARAAYF